MAENVTSLKDSLETFIISKGEPLGFCEITDHFKLIESQKILNELHDLSLQKQIGMLVFSNKIDFPERTLNIQYIKIIEKNEGKEQDNRDIKDNLNELTEKLKELRNKDNELDKILKISSSNALIYKLIHEYNEMKDSATDILGKLAEIQGRPINELFQEYSLTTDD